jgi:uncharacterized FAD-dependent dehydrogenase
MSNIYDVAIVGLGVAGVFCVNKLSTQHKNMKILAVDVGRKWLKRKQFSVGWLGCLPDGSGLMYSSDMPKVASIVGNKKVKSSYNYFNNILSQVGVFNLTKDKSPSINMSKKLAKQGYEVSLNDYTQIYPKEIHLLSKYFATNVEDNKNINFIFDHEVTRIVKKKDLFTVSIEDQDYQCKKVIIATGRAGWRWAGNLYKSLGIIDDNDYSYFGIRVETNSAMLKDFNKSSCTLKKNNIEIGPLSWYGTVVPEDHLDLVISAHRGNEDRWISDKVSFSLIGKRPYPNFGYEQTDRVGKLTFLLANDRVIKEKISAIINGKSTISVLPEYDWLKDAILDLANVIPEITTKAHFHIPTILPLAPKIKLGDNLETEIEGMYAIGESAGIVGILSAALTGIIVADSVKE